MTIIYADTRENRSGVLKELEKIEGVDLKIQILEVADYVVSDRICFERKTAPDFLQDWIESRELFSKLIDMKTAYKRPILLLEGVTSELFERRMIDPKKVQACLNTIARMGIPMIETINAAGTAQTLAWFAQKEQNEEHRPISLHGKRSHLSPSEQLTYTLSSLPDIGSSTAINLLKHFKSLNAIMNANEKELAQVDNVGKKTAAAIHEFYRREWMI